VATPSSEVSSRQPPCCVASGRASLLPRYRSEVHLRALILEERVVWGLVRNATWRAPDEGPQANVCRAKSATRRHTLGAASRSSRAGRGRPRRSTRYLHHDLWGARGRHRHQTAAGALLNAERRRRTTPAGHIPGAGPRRHRGRGATCR
jgi:hypothetical protein